MCILVVVAHPDDESIAMAGTIARHVSDGETVFGVYLTNGVGSRGATSENILNRAVAADLAAKEIGLEWMGKLEFSDNGLDSVPLLKVVQAIEGIKALVNPSLVYTHHFGDLNIDHKITFEATMTAFRPQPNESCREIRTFEVPSSTDYGSFGAYNSFAPNLFLDIEPYWTKKKAALAHYMMEMHDSPHSRSLEGLDVLSKIRGMSVGLHRAEAFNVIRKIY